MKASWLQNSAGDVREVTVQLTRRNLAVLLAKLDGHPPGSGCTIFKDVDGATVYVEAVENDEHYSDEEPPGVMHEDTERAIFARAIDRTTRPPLDYCSEGEYVVASPTEPVGIEPVHPPAYERVVLSEEECRKTCPGFSQCRDLGCQKLADREPNDLHQGV